MSDWPVIPLVPAIILLLSCVFLTFSALRHVQQRRSFTHDLMNRPGFAGGSNF
jgi:hypothetical protein